LRKFFKRLAFVLILALIAVFASFIYAQTLINIDYAREEALLAAELEKETETLNKLKREKDHYMSDSYVEKIAREKLGLVRQDEIVFINDAAR